MISIKNFDVWTKQITIDDSGNEILINEFEEIANSDYKTIRYFKHKAQGYLFVSKMVYQCKLVYSVNEIDADLSSRIEKYSAAIKSQELKIETQEKLLCNAIKSNTNIDLKEIQYWRTITDLSQEKKNMVLFLQENLGV